MKRSILALVVALSVLSAPLGCAGTQAPVTTNPTISQTQATRALAVRIADETTRALAVARQIRQAAQDLTKTAAHPELPIAGATMDTIDKVAIDLGTVIGKALDVLATVTAEPDLKKTAKTIFDAVDVYLAKVPTTGALGYLIPILRGGLVLITATIGA